MEPKEATVRKHGQPHLTQAQAAVALQLRGWGVPRPDVARIFNVRLDTIRKIENGTTYNLRLCEGCDAPVPTANKSRYCDRCKKQVCGSCGGYKSSYRRSHRCAACDRARVTEIQQRLGHHCQSCGVEKPLTRKDRLCAECRDESDLYYKRKRATYEIGCYRCGGELPRTRSWTRNLCQPCAAAHDKLRNSLKRRYCTVEGCGKEIDHLKNDLKCRKCLNRDLEERRKMKKLGLEVLTPEKYAELEEKRLNRFRNGRSVEIPLESLKKGNFVREKQPKDEKGRFLSKNGQSTAQA